MNHHSQRGDVVLASNIFRKREKSVKLRRNHVTVCHSVTLDQRQHLLRIPTIHQNYFVPQLNRDGDEVQHRRVVERRPADVHMIVEGPDPEDREEATRRQRYLIGVGAGQRTPDTLRFARRPGGVEHGSTGCADLGTFVRGAEVAQRGEAVDLTDGVPVRDARFVSSLTGGRTETTRSDKGFGVAVLQDVCNLRAGQVPVDRHDVQAGLIRGEVERNEVGAVVQHHHDAVAGP